MIVHEIQPNGIKIPVDSKKIQYMKSGNYTFDVSSVIQKENKRTTAGSLKKKKTFLVQVTSISVKLKGAKKFEFTPKGQVSAASLIIHTKDLVSDMQKLERMKREAKR